MDSFASFHENGPVYHGLPAYAYASEDFYQREAKSLFPNNWTFIGFAHELARAGDVLPVTLAGKPLLMLRDQQGGIRVFHNVCRHRCLKLVDAPRNVGRVITCPYHAWAYGLDGKLRAAPFFGGNDMTPPEGFDADNTGLVPVRSVVWHDWIFVNLSGTAPEWHSVIAPLAKRLGSIDMASIKPVAMLDFGEVKTNWKFLMENFVEPYHVQFVHKTTTKQPLSGHDTFMDGACVGSTYDLVDTGEDADTGANNENVLSIASRYLTLFPNFILGFYPVEQIGVYQNLPVAPGRTLQRRAIYHVGDNPQSEAEIDALKELWTKVHREDHEMCERLQLGRSSEVADDGGLLSPYWENNVRRFQEMVVEAVA